MRFSALIRSLVATAVLLLPSALANPIEPSVPAVSHLPTPASDNLIIIYGTPSSDRTDRNLTAYHNPSNKAADSATQPSTISKRSYASTCDDCGVWGLNNDLFECRCRAQNGEWAWSTVNLNNCLANNDGYIQWRRNGNFIFSCTFLWLLNTEYETDCRTASGGSRWSFVNLDENIHNWNGLLHCVVPT